MDCRDKWRKHYKDTLIKSSDQESLLDKARLNSSDANIIAARASLEKAGFGQVDLLRLLPDHVLDPAIDIMAVVRAYFQGTSSHIHARAPDQDFSCIQALL